MPSLFAGRRSPGPGRATRFSPLTGLYAVAALLLVAVGAFVVLRDGPEPETRRTTPSSNPSADALLPQQLSGARQFSGPEYGLPGHHPTEDKNQTKLWYAGGSWWGVLLERRSLTKHIFQWSDGRWRDTGVVVDPRERSQSDVVWTGGDLYVASRVSNGSSYLTHYRLRGDDTWESVTAFPRTIAAGGSTSLSIAVDSLDRVWAVFNRDQRVWVTNSRPGGGQFVAERLMPGRNNLQPDDTAAVVAAGGRVAVLWSDQRAGGFRFALREDSEPSDQMTLRPLPLRGLRIADGHVHLRAMRDGRILAAVKTSLGDADVDPPRSPLLVLLVRAPNGGWSKHVMATTADRMTRPQIVLSEDERLLYMLASSPQSGGKVYVKVANTTSWSFAPGLGTQVLGTTTGKINNATTGRGRVSSRTGLLVLAADATVARYYTAEIPIAKQ